MMMNNMNFATAFLLCLLATASAFQPQPLLLRTTTSVMVHHDDTTTTPTTTTALCMAYVPDGFTPESYQKFKQQEAAKKQKNLGRLGPKGFQSRSMRSFQEALERGEASHLMPVFNSKEKIARGEIRPEDVPYMQRGGSWDNSDVRGARNKKKWLQSDKQYAAGGYQNEQSVSILGMGAGLDWTGTQRRSGPGSEGVLGAAPKFGKNYKPPNVKSLQKDDSNNKKKKNGFFGMF